MRSQFDHQKTTEARVKNDTVDRVKLLKLYPSLGDTGLIVLKLNDQSRQQQKNTMGDRMVA